MADSTVLSCIYERNVKWIKYASPITFPDTQQYFYSNACFVVTLNF